MNTYLVRRFGIAANASELDAALTRLRTAAMPRCRTLCAYALREADGRFGLVCVAEADGVRAVREHAACAGLAADEITPLLGRVVFHGDATSEAPTPQARTA